MKINISEIIRFYDEKSCIDSHHVSAITGLVGEDIAAGLIKYYFEQNKSVVNILEKSPSEEKETEKKKAKKLDRWIKVLFNNKTTFYQTEIKSWCSHSYSGKKVDTNSIIKYSHDRFAEQWDYTNQTLKHEYVSKVLKKMKSPDGFKNGDCIAPLVCFWFPILPNTKNDPVAFYSENCKSSNFKTVYFFSLSIYLRELSKTQTEIEIDVPNIEKRLNQINKMFYEKNSPAHNSV